MKEPYMFALFEVLTEPDVFRAALQAYDDDYTGLFVVLDDEERYVKLLVEYRTSWCIAQIWTYNKDGGPFPETFDLTGDELRAIAKASEWMSSEV